MPQTNDTIAAIATPPGSGGVGIVRVSGPLALTIGRALFRAVGPGGRDFEPRRLHLGDVLGSRGRPVDRVLAVAMPGPNSYTGEDVMEFHCHGGPAVLAQVLEAALGRGARPAGPGEFTRRAFLAGKLELSQAEAVAELTAARSPAEAEMARSRLSGALGARVRALRDGLLALRARLCAAVDFPDEDIECLPPREFAAGVALAGKDVAALAAAYERGRVWREGAVVVLAGPVNAGKSSLMNALLGRQRAIVADLPGTTRDWLEESLNLDGLAVRLVDTAGLRDPAAAADAVELAGMERSRERMDRADLVLLVHDGALPATDEELALARDLAKARRGLAVVNKADLPRAAPDPAAALTAAGLPVAEVCAASGAGLEGLAWAIRAAIVTEAAGPGEAGRGELTPNLRQSQALGRAAAELDALRLDITAGLPYDLLGVRLEAACALLAEVTGELAPQEVLDAVFGTFCIGK